MPAAKLADAHIRRLQPPASGHAIHWDSEVSGFGLRVTTAGAKSFVLGYRWKGSQRRMTIGSFPVWTTAGARDEAKRLRRLVDQGQDPLGERHAERSAPTVTDLAEHYRSEHMPTKRASSQAGDEQTLRKHILPALGRLKVADVGRSDIATLHRKITRTGHPIAANRTMALLAKMFSLAVREGWRTDNPVKGVDRNQEAKRERYLTEDEVSRLMTALNDHRAPSANAVKLLLLTGARRGEVLGARWQQFDLDRGVWVKPASATKQGKLHRLPLSVEALELLQTMRAEADQRVIRARERHDRILPAPDLLFPRPGQVDPQHSLRRLWASLCRSCGIADCRLHDLRHTHASILVSSGLSLETIGGLLGHSNPTTTARYAHLADATLRAAANVVGRYVTDAKPRVVPLSAGAAAVTPPRRVRRPVA